MADATIACPIGMPRNDHKKKSPNITQAAKLMAWPLEVLLPGGAGEPPQTEHRANDHRDHEHHETR